MNRRARRWLAVPMLMTLLAAPVRAEDEPVKPEEQSGFWGYLAAGAFTVMIIFAVCKPVHRELNTPKPGSTGFAKF